MSDFSGLVDRLGANPGIGVTAGFYTKELKSSSRKNKGDSKNKAVEESLGIEKVCHGERKGGCLLKRAK